ncbi:MAG: L-2-hydroxyglutarate oxidase [Spirochaetota bacterium]
MAFDYAIVGGGIVGLATAMRLGQARPESRIVLFEKEEACALHQTGRNSGVIHSGLYYKPGSYKARFAREGNRSMIEFCEKQGIRHEVCGKLVIATSERELLQLERLFQRGRDNELPLSKLTAEQVREIEPHVSCLAGLRVPTTGIVSYSEVCVKYAELIRALGGEVKTGTKVLRIREVKGVQRIETGGEVFEARFGINCAGLHSDRVARSAGTNAPARIIPFRGEYYELVPDKRYLVKSLVYPVPNPDFPFLGVHFTRMIDGSVHAGPNAVLAFKREGYHRTSFSARDTWDTLSYPGFWKLARRNLGEGWMEIRRSFSKAEFLRSLRLIIPELRGADIVSAEAGVRAQALLPDGNLVDDFLFVEGRASLHVCNAPSPAATASLEIAKTIVSRLP